MVQHSLLFSVISSVLSVSSVVNRICFSSCLVLTSRFQARLRALRVSVAAALILVSFVINYRGANDGYVYRWNREPVDIDVLPSRVWDWGDLQFLRGRQDPNGSRS